MRVAFFDLEGWEKNTIEKALTDHQLLLTGEPLDTIHKPENRNLEIISFFVSSHIDKEILEKLPKLKLIATRSTGFDHIDINACRKRGVAVAHVPGYGDDTVAEFTFGLMLALIRKIHYPIRQIKEAKMLTSEHLRGADLKGKTLGVIGTGRIGKKVIRLAKGFEMEIVAHDVYEDKGYAKKMGYNYVPLDNLLEEADVITLHCPCMKETYHLLNKENMRKVKKGAYLVNAARGELVDTNAMIEALQNKTLAGAALDVLEEEKGPRKEQMALKRGRSRKEELETMLGNHTLMNMQNVLITPHNAFNSQQAVERMLGITLKNITSFIAGKPQNVVT
jgi:D-lactate dehydrogenase